MVVVVGPVSAFPAFAVRAVFPVPVSVAFPMR